MSAKLRTKVATAVVAILVGGLLAWFATAGPAVAFFSGGLFLDVQVKATATLLAKGAAVQVPVEVTCNATGTASVSATVTQKSGSGVARGVGSAQVGCAGPGEQITVLVQATGAKPFKKAAAVATAEIFGCNNVTCGRETDSEVVQITTTSAPTTTAPPTTTVEPTTTAAPTTIAVPTSSGGDDGGPAPVTSTTAPATSTTVTTTEPPTTEPPTTVAPTTTAG